MPFRAGLAGWSCDLWADTAEGRRQLSLFFPPCPLLTRVPSTRIEALLAGDGSPTLRIFDRDHPVSYHQLGESPWLRRFVPKSGTRSPQYEDAVYVGEPALELRGDDIRVLKSEQWLQYAYCLFLAMLFKQAPVIGIHSAACAVGARLLVLVGPSGAGKSTLAAALREQGARYFGDELTLFSQPDLRPTVLPRELCLRPGGAAALGTVVPPTAWQLTKPNDLKYRAAPPAAGGEFALEQVVLVCLDDFAARPELRPLGGSEATRRVFRALSSQSTAVSDCLEAAAILVDRIPCWGLAPGPPAATAALLISRLG